MKNLFTLLLLAVTALTFAQESTLLRLNYKTGENYVMLMNMKQNMGNGNMTMNMTMEMPMKVISVKDGIYSAEMSFKSIKMDMEQAGNKINYDSNIKETNLDETAKMMSSQMQPILETVLLTKTNMYGEVLEMKMIKGSGNVNQFTSQTESVVYPKEAVTVGYSWVSEKDNNGMKIKNTYTVKSIDNKVVVLNLSGDITGMSKGNLSGSMNIDRASGVPMLSTVNMNIEVMGQKLDTEMVMTMKKTE
ncbi:DUF6263 family protein [Gelatiniphilus marinus]|uniref:DUF6263 family protein n=1 Tax=Gelatiniphilus marinus TaxID=1759464 RepID=A0ABW5JU80_9FLAO